jgi:hypothetical protein
MFKNRYKYISTTLDNESRMSSSPTDLDGLRRLMALITSDSEKDAKVKNSEDDKRVGMTAGQGLLYTD